MKPGKYLKSAGPSPTATMWVSRDTDGQKVLVKVSEMSDSHLFRWIRYFRQKWRDEGFLGSNATLDQIIQHSMVTAPAIYAEAKKRGVLQSEAPTVPAVSKPEPVPAPKALMPGARLITLEDADD